jgi:hypothetical protein
MKQSHVGGQQYAGPNPAEKNAFASDKCSLLYGENNITSKSRNSIVPMNAPAQLNPQRG